MKIVSAISLALALACFLSVHYAEAACKESTGCTACQNNNGCKWCSVTFPITGGDEVFDTTIGYCDTAARNCKGIIPDEYSYAAAAQLSPKNGVIPGRKHITSCPAIDKEIGDVTSVTSSAVCVEGAVLCLIVTGYPGSGKAKTGGFYICRPKAALCTPATFPLHSKAFPGATLAMSVPTKAADIRTDGCNVHRTCATCPSADCRWCDLALTDGAEDPRDVTSGFGICVPNARGKGFMDADCPDVPPQLSAMTSGLTPNPAVGWATRYIPEDECGNHVPTYSTGAWSSFETKTACNSNPSTAWCDLTGVARTDGAATTPLNSGGICMDLFASGSCHAGWYLYPSPTVGFEMDGSF